MVRLQCAVQAQDYPNSKWALALRASEPLTDAAVERACDAGEILRTHVLRPTWHFVAPEDLRWLLQLTGSRVKRVMAVYNPALGLTPAVLRRSNQVIAKALAGHRYLTRAELRLELERARLKADGSQRLSRVMMEAEVDGIICSGPMRGKQFTYALLDERAPLRGPQYDRDDALGELARRYFVTRSPATAHDLAWWSGLTIGDARRAIAAAGNLREWSSDGRAYWIDASIEPPVRRQATAHLLPNYDEYFIGYRDRSAIGTRISNVAAVTGGNALIAHVAFIDGLLVGGWRRRVDGDTTVIDIKPVTPLTPAERRRLEREGKRFGAFLGRPVEMRWAK